ncbi:MAG: prolipoprotein diacylglyceryl transferase [Alphaproteobacteria bacterium]|nr:prolipoprotein diacylglyceryl transferase [Alphaproteobacteria bacterium]MCL2889721.1 prolipoprotein diacylglyceryl transferase [Alphaproteobacteria bacterium]
MLIINPISPVAFSILGFDIRWYALAYIAAFVVGYWVMRWLVKSARAENFPPLQTKKSFDDLLTYIIIGTIAGGRLGYVLFYNLSYFIEHPLEIFAIWHGGMAFHGGLIGVLVAVFLFARRGAYSRPGRKYAPLQNGFAILDLLAIVAPIGIFFGRIANFINMEVMGRTTDGPLGIVFAGATDQTPRHASPLYEAALEGIVLFLIMFTLWRFTRMRERIGALSGIFAISYAVLRIFAEQFREPDAHIGFLTSWGLTMGQLLSAGMIAAGTFILIWSFRRK